MLKYNEENLNKQKDLIASQSKKNGNNSATTKSALTSPSNLNTANSPNSGTTAVKAEANLNEETTNKNPTTSSTTIVAAANSPSSQSVAKEPQPVAFMARSVRSTRKVSNEPNSIVTKAEAIEQPPGLNLKLYFYLKKKFSKNFV